MMRSRRIFIVSIAIFLIAVIGHVSTLGPLESAHLKIRDIFFRLRGPIAVNPQIAIVTIDDESIYQYGRWPWPRARIAALIHRLSEAGVRTIGIDVSFLPTAEQAKPGTVGTEFAPLVRWLGLKPSHLSSYSHEQLLAMAIKKSGNVVLPFYCEFKSEVPEKTGELPVPLAHSAYLLFDDLTRLPSLPLLRGSTVFPPAQSLREAAAALGCVNAFLGRDGVLRNDPAIIAYGNQYFPSLGIQLVRLHLGLSWAEVKVNSGQNIQLGHHLVPTDNRGFLDLLYYGGRGRFPHLSYKAVLAGDVKPESLQDKLVLVGVSAAGLHDLWQTPFGPGYPGVEKHATVAANILDDRFVLRPELISAVEVFFMLLSALLLSFSAARRRSWPLWAVAVLLLLLPITGSYLVFAGQNLWLKPLFPALLILVLTPLLQVLRLCLPVMYPEPAVVDGRPALQTMALESPELEADVTLSTIGRYRIEGELGQGAMGIVYKAVDPKIGRPVAIKTIRLDQSLTPEALRDLRERSLREAQVAGQLSHPNIVTIYDVVESGGHLYIAMEYIEGEELTRFCDRNALLEPRQATAIIAQVCDALDYAHNQGIVHRDIKPGNIMILKDRRPKIMDFGITKALSADATQTAALLGTPSYMSPEQIDLEQLDGRSDLFSVGTMFYELLCGERPFTGPNITAILRKIADAEPTPLREVNPKVHPKLAEVVNKLLTKDRSARHQHGAEVLTDLSPLLADPSVWE